MIILKFYYTGWDTQTFFLNQRKIIAVRQNSFVANESTYFEVLNEIC